VLDACPKLKVAAFFTSRLNAMTLLRLILCPDSRSIVSRGCCLACALLGHCL